MWENLVGQTLDRYNIIRLVREDSLGAIFKAYDPTLLRDFATQIINPAIANRPNFSEDFAEIARTAARLDHPNIVHVHNFGQARSFNYLVSEYIPGGNLEALLMDLKRDGRWILLSEAVQIVRHLAMAMEYVRNLGVPQRRFDPPSLMIKPVQSNSLPYLPVSTDTGISRLVDKGESTAPAYLSPEGAMGRHTDARSDGYSLGILLFELCTGQLPFQIQTLDDAVRYHMRQPLPPPNSIRPDLPVSLQAVIVKALEKNPEKRFPSPSALADELERIYPEVAQVTSAPPALESAVSLLVPYRRSVVETGEEMRRATQQEGTVTTPIILGSSPQAGQPRGQAGCQVDIILENPQLSVEPGSRVTVPVILANHGPGDGRFAITLEGVPVSWVTIAPQVLPLSPGEQKDVRILIQPPRSPQSRAGRYPITIRAVDQRSPGCQVETKGTLTITAFSSFTSELFTRSLASGETGQVGVNNQGNTPDAFTIYFRDPRGELAFTPPQTHVRLAEGQSGVSEFRVAQRQLHLIGGERVQPFSAQVSSSAGEAQAHNGEVISQPLVPVWVLGILLLVFVCIAASFLFLLNQSGAQSARATQTLIAAQTGTVVAIQSTFQAQTATALFLADANQATIQAVTATASWLALDNDGDGLTNQRELEIQTNPDLPDTDGDGLSDGDEANRQTNPLNPDTDGDGISDGEEVTQGFDPLQPDTDGDGLPDGQDPNPRLTSTPSPNPQATAQAQTQTAAVLTATAQTGFQQATQVAANATATAQAAAALATAQAATATAQVGANQTATSQAATAAAQAVAAQTATAQAAATQTVAARVRVVYIYSTDPGLAEAYQSLLQGNGFLVDLVDQVDILTTDFGPYRAIVLGPETGENDTWGDVEGTQATRLASTVLPVLGLGQGGYAYFGRLGLSIGWENGITGEGANIFVVDPGNPVWATPNPITVPANRILNLYNNNSAYVAINGQSPPGDVSLVGRLPEDENHYPLVRQTANYFLWGFSRGPGAMTALGQQVFVNVLRSLVPS